MANATRGRSLFLTGTDTDVGKTYVGCLIARDAVQQGLCVGAYKPVASGVESPQESDGYRLWEATGFHGTFDSVSPQRFAAPFAPSVAAALEGKQVDEKLIFSTYEARRLECELLLVEGAGGLFSPVSKSRTNADLIREMKISAILVANWKLGLVHQVLCALHAAAHCHVKIAMIVLSEPSPQTQESSQSHLKLLQKSLEFNADWKKIPLRALSNARMEWPEKDQWIDLAQP